METFAILLVGIAVAVQAAQLQLDNVEENGLEGIYRPTTNTSDYYIKISVIIEKDTVVSSSEIILTGEVVPLVSLKVPLLYKNKRVIDHMLEKILLAARRTAAVYNQTANMPLFSELIASYNNLADEMNKAISDKKGSQVFFMIMYHSTIIGSAFRIAIGAQEDWEICEPSPRYTNGTGVFVCEQDVQSYIDSLYSTKKIKFRRFTTYVYINPRVHCCCCDYWFCGWMCSFWCCPCCPVCHCRPFSKPTIQIPPISFPRFSKPTIRMPPISFPRLGKK